MEGLGEAKGRLRGTQRRPRGAKGVSRRGLGGPIMGQENSGGPKNHVQTIVFFFYMLVLEGNM